MSTEESLLNGLNPDQMAALRENRRRVLEEHEQKPRKRRAPDGQWRPAGDAQVIPIDDFLASKNGLPAAVRDQMADDPHGWAERVDQLIADVDRQAADVAEAERRGNRFASYLRRRNPRYAEASYGMLRPEQQHGGKIARWWSSSRRPRSLLLTGLSRTGKSTAAYAIANEAHADGAWVEVYTEIDLNAQLRGANAEAVWARAIGCDLLFLDDWGRLRASDWWKERLHELFELRLAGGVRGQRLLVTANTPSSQEDAYAELVTRYGDPILERVIDGGGILMFDGPRIRELVQEW